jgi:hypothetical protein
MRSGAPLVRDRSKPGSAAHHEAVLRCARDTREASKEQQ